MTDLWPGLVRSSPQPLRIGDAERDQAVSALAEHFAAGRLNRDEYDERAELALQARFSDDLARLFADLPGQAVATERPHRGQPPRVPVMVMMTMPLLTLGLIITALAIGAPWMLFGVFWFVMLGGFGFRRFGGHHHHGQHHHGHHHQRGRTLGP